jgi:hypothetical protein
MGGFMSLILDGTNGLSDVDGTAAAPAIRGTDANTGIFFPAADTIAFAEGGAEAMRINSSGNVGIGTSSPTTRLDVSQANAKSATGVWHIQTFDLTSQATGVGGGISFSGYKTAQSSLEVFAGIDGYKENATAGNAAGALRFHTQVSGGTGLVERARIDSSGNLLVGKTAAVFADAGSYIGATGKGVFTVNNDEVILLNRLASDGNLIRFYQATTEEGNISVSGTTVSYNGGHLSRWAQMLTKPELFKGTVLSNLDEMNIYTDVDGNPVDNEQLNKVKVSDVEGDANVAGVFVNWSHDEDHNVDEINMAMTGDMIIRIAQGVTVARGDLLMSAGDGTAKPQGDDIVRSKTVAKVTSTHVTCTYADGSFCVPCVLMAC